MFFKTIFKNSNKIKSIRNYVSKCNVYVFLDITKIADFGRKNADVGRTQGVCHVIYIFFGSILGKV